MKNRHEDMKNVNVNSNDSFNAVTTSAGITMNLPTAAPGKSALKKPAATEQRANDFKSSMPSTC